MRDTKSLLLLILSMLLIIVSLALLWTWGYNYGTQKTLSKKIISKDTVSVSAPVNDSIKALYQEAKNNFSAIDSVIFIADSLKIDIGDKLAELNTLRDEIKELLKKPNDFKEIQNAQVKIGTLQEKVDALLDQNKDIIRENRRLTGLIRQMAKVNPPNTEVQNKSTLSSAGIPKTNSESVTPITELNIKGWIEQGGANVESMVAEELNGLNGSFLFFNNQLSKPKGELYIVVIRPDGKTLRSSGWESGSFDTNEGRRGYTSKLNFEVNNGDRKKMNFNVAVENLTKGNYQIQIFQSGNNIYKSDFQLN